MLAGVHGDDTEAWGTAGSARSPGRPQIPGGTLRFASQMPRSFPGWGSALRGVLWGSPNPPVEPRHPASQPSVVTFTTHSQARWSSRRRHGGLGAGGNAASPRTHPKSAASPSGKPSGTYEAARVEFGSSGCIQGLAEPTRRTQAPCLSALRDSSVLSVVNSSANHLSLLESKSINAFISAMLL